MQHSISAPTREVPVASASQSVRTPHRPDHDLSHHQQAAMEAGLLGTLLLDAISHRDILSDLNVDLFAYPGHRAIASAMKHLAEGGYAVTLATVTDLLQTRDILHLPPHPGDAVTAVSVTGLLDQADGSPTRAVAVLTRRATVRAMRELAALILEATHDPDRAPVEELCTLATQVASDVARRLPARALRAEDVFRGTRLPPRSA